MLPTPRLRPWYYLIFAIPFAAAGCGPGMGQIEGKIVWSDGSPAKELSGGQVVFESEELKTSARGEIDSEGHFRLRTNKPDDGAAVGEYAVAIIEHRLSTGGEGSSLAAPKIETRYYDMKTSNLKATVKPGVNPVTLTVERAVRK